MIARRDQPPTSTAAGASPGISSIDDANRWLPTFQADYNSRFAREPRSAPNAHRPLGPHETLQNVFHCKVERKLSINLTLNYKRTLYLIERSGLTNALRGKRVLVIEAEDGTVRIRYGDQDQPATAFEKEGNVSQQDVEDNKRLGHILEQLRQKQLETSRQQLESRNRSLREKRRLRDSINERR